jgi:hypothetical protein
LRRGENNTNAHAAGSSTSASQSQANQLEPKSWGGPKQIAPKFKATAKSQGHVPTSSSSLRVAHSDKDASNIEPLLSSWRPAVRPASAMPSERPSVKGLPRPWSASAVGAKLGSSRSSLLGNASATRPLSASGGFRDVDSLARDLLRKHTTEVPKPQPSMWWMHEDSRVDAGTTSLDVLLEKTSREYFNSDEEEDEDFADECFQGSTNLARHNPDLALRVKKNMVTRPDEEEGPVVFAGQRGNSNKNKTAKVLDLKMVNIGDETNFKSVAVLFEAKLLEVSKLPQRGDGGPSELKTAACCQLLKQLSHHIGYHGPLLRRLAQEIFASIYQDYKARRGASASDTVVDNRDRDRGGGGDTPMPFDLVPYYAVVRSMQDELSLLRTEKRSLKQRCWLSYTCACMHTRAHTQ